MVLPSHTPHLHITYFVYLVRGPLEECANLDKVLPDISNYGQLSLVLDYEI